MLLYTENRYEGVTIDAASLPASTEKFKEDITELMVKFSHKQLLWANIPIEKSDFVPVLTQLGFEFHHCDERNLMLVKQLTPGAYIPTTKNYIVGVGAVVMHQGKLLVIKDRFNAGYKLPGGHIDKGESIKEALKREVLEETGVQIDFESIVNLGHFKNGQFGESNLYIVCTAKALSTAINIADSIEISEAKWMELEAFLQDEEVNNYNKSVVKAAYGNKELKLTEQQVKLRVSSGEVFY